MQKTINVNLDVNRAIAQPSKIPTLVVGDTGNKINITMYDNGAAMDLTGYTRILVVFSKVSDGSVCEQDTQDAVVNLPRVGLTVTGTPANNDFINVMWTSSPASTSITCSTGLSVAINRETFAAAYPDYGTYNFTYEVANAWWKSGANSVTVSGNVITVNPVKTGSFGYGKNNVEVQFYEDDELITSAQFNFDGRKAILDDDTIKSTDNFPILLDLIRRVESAESKAGDMKKTDYDSNTDGQVNDADHADEADDADKLGGQLPSYYATLTQLATHASQHSSDGTDPVTPASIGAAAASTSATATLAYGTWTGTEAPYSYTLSVSGVTATSPVEILPGASITSAQLEALQGANIQDGGQSAGSITLSAYGDKPEIDLPIRIIVRGDL